MLLLDTHAALWLALSPDLLSVEARESISEARREAGLAISDKSLWEIAMLASSRRLHLRITLRTMLDAFEERFVILPITAKVAELSVQFSAQYPRDPADRIIGATALAHRIPLVSADPLIRRSGEFPCIW